VAASRVAFLIKYLANCYLIYKSGWFWFLGIDHQYNLLCVGVNSLSLHGYPVMLRKVGQESPLSASKNQFRKTLPELFERVSEYVSPPGLPDIAPLIGTGFSPFRNNSNSKYYKILLR
jgi:hypothetical protein